MNQIIMNTKDLILEQHSYSDTLWIWALIWEVEQDSKWGQLSSVLVSNAVIMEPLQQRRLALCHSNGLQKGHSETGNTIDTMITVTPSQTCSYFTTIHSIMMHTVCQKDNNPE